MRRHFTCISRCFRRIGENTLAAQVLLNLVEHCIDFFRIVERKSAGLIGNRLHAVVATRRTDQQG